MATGVSLFCVMWILGSVATVQSLFGDFGPREDDLNVMGLEASATSKDIKKKYKRLALKYHPDKNQDADAAEKFRTMKGAYDRLTAKEAYAESDDDERFMCRHSKGYHYVHIIFYFDEHIEGQSYHTLFEMAAKTEKRRVTKHWQDWILWEFGAKGLKHSLSLFCVEMVPFVSAPTFEAQWSLMQYHNDYIVGVTVFNDAMVGENHIGVEFKNDASEYYDDHRLSRRQLSHLDPLVVKDLDRGASCCSMHLYVHGCNTGVYEVKKTKPKAVFKALSTFGFRYNSGHLQGENRSSGWMQTEGEKGYTYFSSKKNKYEEIDPKTVEGDAKYFMDVYLRAYNFEGSRNWGKFYTPWKVFKMEEAMTPLQ